jgi:predicted transcriptional regulator
MLIFHSLRRWRELGPLEQRILESVWERGDATVRELIAGGYEGLAYTTVMTTLDRLFKKELLKRSTEGQAFRYFPLISREEFHRRVAGEAFHRLFDTNRGSRLPLSFLVEIVCERDAALLEDLRKLVDIKRRELARHKQRRKGME